MQHWTKVKEESKPGNIQGMIDDMLKRKRASQKDGSDLKNQRQNQEEKDKKLLRRKERAVKKEEDLYREAKESYLSKEQYQFMDKMIKNADVALKQQQGHIDIMEQKMIQTLATRRTKETQEADGVDGSGNPKSASLQLLKK